MEKKKIMIETTRKIDFQELMDIIRRINPPKDKENKPMNVIANAYKDNIGYHIIFEFDGKYIALLDDGTYTIYEKKE